MIRYQLFILTHLGPVIAGLSVWVEADAAGGEPVSTTCGASGLLRDEDNGVGDKEDGSIPASEWALLALGTPYNTKHVTVPTSISVVFCLKMYSGNPMKTFSI